MSGQPIGGSELDPGVAAGGRALTDIARPMLAVPPPVLVVSLTTAGVAAEATPARVRRLTQEWVALDPELRPHRGELAALLEVVTGQVQPGEVAAFLDCRRLAAEGRLVGGAAVLSLELVARIPGSTRQRAQVMAGHLRRSAADPDAAARFCTVTTRRTASGVSATRIRFVAAAPVPAGPAPAGSADAGLEDGVEVALRAALDAGGPVVEVCRWLYPVPRRADLVWALGFQTTDLDQADDLVGAFDRLAGSLGWVEPDG